MENKVKDQVVTERYAIYNSDCMLVLPTLDTESIDLSVYSPPFAGLYNYSSSENDFSNCENKEQFLDQYEFLIKEIARVTKKGRITAVHVTDIFDNTCRLWDFPHEIIILKSILQNEGIAFLFLNETLVSVNPLASYAYGGIQLKIHPNDFETVQKILDELNNNLNIV